MSEIDAELLSAARVLDGSLRGLRLPTGNRAGMNAIALSPNDQRRLSLPRDSTEELSKDTAKYFAIWLRDGRLLRLEGVPEMPDAKFDSALVGQEIVVLQRDHYRELRIVGPAGTQILVGRNIASDIDALGRLAAQIILISIGILTVGLIGGWWLSRSVLRPIKAMSEIAAQFWVSSESPRISIVETDSELGELAGILNDAFDRVEASFARQQQFAADASHELRTPLAVIQSQIELALRKERTPEEYTTALKTCADAEVRLSELVESLLALARLDSGDAISVRQPVRLDLLVAKCTDLMRPLAARAAVKLTDDVTPAWVLGDSSQLERAILNLIKNAVTYNVEGGAVQVAVTTNSSSTILSIHDTGVGISAEDLSRVTERFFRVDKARSRQQGGSGLGLSIAKQTVESHQGTFQISSEQNKGTCVTAEIPLATAERS